MSKSLIPEEKSREAEVTTAAPIARNASFLHEWRRPMTLALWNKTSAVLTTWAARKRIRPAYLRGGFNLGAPVAAGRAAHHPLEGRAEGAFGFIAE